VFVKQFKPLAESRSIQKIQDDIVEEFDMLGEVQEKQWHIIHIGERNPGIAEEDKTDENRIYGCQSLVWVVPSEKEGALYFKGDSNSPFVKGLVTLVLKIVSDHTAEEILESKIDFLERVGLESHTSFFRRNGLESLVKKLRSIAADYINQKEAK
jgi:cysteine desulfuration protein SufE